MKLAPDWQKVLQRAWSVGFIAAAFLFSVAEIALPDFGDALPISPHAFGALSGAAAGAAAGAAFVSRLLAQSSLSKGEPDAGQ